MVILYLEVLIGIGLIVINTVMLCIIKRNNDNWWRTYWAKEKVMLDKLNETNRKIDRLFYGE